MTMNTARYITLTGMLCVLALAPASWAQAPAARVAATPGLINYQGRLLTPAGGVYSNGVYTIEFRLYDVENGGSPGVWGAKYPVYVKDGYFNVMLGANNGQSVTPAPTYGPMELWRALWYDLGAVAKINDRYLGITVTYGPDTSLPDPAVEAFPRQRFLSAPFAERAQMAQYARAAFDTFSVGSTLVATGLVTAVGGLNVQSSTTLTNTTITGTATLNQGLAVNNQQAVFTKGFTVTGSTAYVRSSLDVSGAANFRGGVNATNSKIQEAGCDLIPRGVIVMWAASSTPPDGWAICDGTRGTPNLRGKFVVGYDSTNTDYSVVGNSGGEAKHALVEGELAAHKHDFTVGTVGYAAAWNGSAEATRAPGQSRNNGDRTQVTVSKGSGIAHENRPPYYVVVYIMKL